MEYGRIESEVLMKKHFKAIELKYLDDDIIMKIREWRNQPFVRNKMYSQHDITEEEHKKYIQALLNDENRGLFVFYLDDEPFGVFQYVLHKKDNCVECGNYLVDEEYQNLGYGTLMIFFQSEIIFNIFGCKKSCGEILECNKNIISMNKKMGAQLERIESKDKDGILYNVHCYSYLADNWINYREKYEKIVYTLIDDFNLKKDVIY